MHTLRRSELYRPLQFGFQILQSQATILSSKSTATQGKSE